MAGLVKDGGREKSIRKSKKCFRTRTQGMNARGQGPFLGGPVPVRRPPFQIPRVELAGGKIKQCFPWIQGSLAEKNYLG